MLNKKALLEIIANGENSSVEFKRDDIRPEQLAKEIVAMANFQGGMILLGVDDTGNVTGINRSNPEEWIMDTVIGRYVHPVIIPHYQEIRLDNGKRIVVISISSGTAKPYVLRHNDREDVYIRMGSTSRLATREQIIRLFDAGGLLHTETLPVSGTGLKTLDMARLENYLSDILGEHELPVSETEWLERLDGLGFMITDAIGNNVCTIAGTVLFGIKPRRFLKQAGLRVMVFDSDDKQYQARLDVILDGPMVGRWSFDGEKTLVDEGIIEKFIHTIEPFITIEGDSIDPKTLTRGKKWMYPIEAIRETVLNALAHRDWTRAVDIEITRYSDRLEVISPGALPNSMDIEKMKAGRRTPRNALILEVLRDYGYVDARGMGVRTKIIPLTIQFTGKEPVFEATEDYLKTILPAGSASEKGKRPLKTGEIRSYAPENAPNAPENPFQRKLLELIRGNPKITYDMLARATGRDRKTVRRHIVELKQDGWLKRIGPARGGHWEVTGL
ncbi:MAG: ATP-dependent DNA helicase [bacterium]|nr:MAG: ATP-dependent DNA helicase [bacterium]